MTYKNKTQIFFTFAKFSMPEKDLDTFKIPTQN